MSQNTQTPLIAIPAKVQAFAAERGVSEYLPAVLEMTDRLFPDKIHWQLLVEDDSEIANLRHLVIVVAVAGYTPEQHCEMTFRWSAELFHHCPAPFVCVFQFGLEMVAPIDPPDVIIDRMVNLNERSL